MIRFHKWGPSLERRPGMRNERGRGSGGGSEDIGKKLGKIFKMLLLIAGIVGLAVIFLLMVLPRDRVPAPPIKKFTPPEKMNEKPKGDTVKIDPKIDKNSIEPEIDEDLFDPGEDDFETVVLEEDEVNEEKVLDYTGVYVGAGEIEIANSSTMWEFSMEISGDRYLYVEGKVNYIEDSRNGTGKEITFVILEDSIEMKISQTNKDEVVITGNFDGEKANIFSVNDRRQFFLYVTPGKVNIDTKPLLEKLLIKKENTPLIDMSGFIKDDGAVVGMFRNPFGDVIEYELSK
jgi:hypothetical protein